MKFFKLLLSLIVISTIGQAGSNPDFPEDQYLKVNVIFTNDMHGGIARTEAGFINPDFPPILGNGPAAIAYIKKTRQQSAEKNEGFILLDAGDCFQGTPVGTLSKGDAVIKYMNMAGYDVMAAGNHDFDLGWDNLKRLSEMADFPFLAANICRESTGEVAEFVKPYIIKEIQGIKIGIIGTATSATPEMSYPEHVADLDFQAEIPVVRKYVEELRSQGVNTIIVETHTWLPYDPDEGYKQLQEQVADNKFEENRTGVSAQDISYAVPGIDIMFSGHVHRGFYDPWIDPVNHTLHFQNYANGSNLGHVIFYIHKKTGTLAGYNFVNDAGAIFTLFEDDFYPDTTTARIIENLVKKAEAGFDEVIGTAKANFTRSSDGESGMGNLVVDATRIKSNADISFSNHGGIRSDMSAGPVTPRSVFAVMPFANRIMIMNVSGEFLTQLIEDRVTGNSHGMLVSGCEVEIDRTQPNGSRVKSFKIDGETVQPDKIYKLAISDYLAEGNSGYGRLLEVPVDQISYTGIVIRQAIIDYIKESSPISPTVDGRWREIK